MADGYTHLIGAERVSDAGHSIANSAHQMQQAANTFAEYANRLTQALDEHALRLERNATSGDVDTITFMYPQTVVSEPRTSPADIEALRKYHRRTRLLALITPAVGIVLAIIAIVLASGCAS